MLSAGTTSASIRTSSNPATPTSTPGTSPRSRIAATAPDGHQVGDREDAPGHRGPTLGGSVQQRHHRPVPAVARELGGHHVVVGHPQTVGREAGDEPLDPGVRGDEVRVAGEHGERVVPLFDQRTGERRSPAEVADDDAVHARDARCGTVQVGHERRHPSPRGDEATDGRRDLGGSGPVADPEPIPSRRLTASTTARGRSPATTSSTATSRDGSPPVEVIVTTGPASSAARIAPAAIAAKYGSAMSPTTSARVVVDPRATACACTLAV
ncbi:hypothetical protein Q9Q99_20205 [Curtobacterium flaccumfaciens]|nr:hypothetical protein Q9Q99_20205 [Curtobacterium flaccumfaciens]